VRQWIANGCCATAACDYHTNTAAAAATGMTSPSAPSRSICRMQVPPVDLHTLHWHGTTLLMDDHRTDVVDLLPSTFRTLYMVPDAPGAWLMHCERRMR
jgi:Multicopper oxidase